MNEQQKAELEAEVKASLADFIEHQQRALAAAGRACDSYGSSQFESHLKVAGATSLAGFRRLVGNFAELASEWEEAGLCGPDAADSDEADQPEKRKRSKRLRIHLSSD